MCLKLPLQYFISRKMITFSFFGQSPWLHLSLWTSRVQVLCSSGMECAGQSGIGFQWYRSTSLPLDFFSPPIFSLLLNVLTCANTERWKQSILVSHLQWSILKQEGDVFCEVMKGWMEAHTQARLLAECRGREGHVFAISLLLSRARPLISAWAELEPTHLNLFIFLGEIQRTRGRLWWKPGPPTVRSFEECCFSL